jgi:hypothetical protein
MIQGNKPYRLKIEILKVKQPSSENSNSRNDRKEKHDGKD